MLELEQLNRLFTIAFPYLQSAAYSQHPALLVWDCDRILEQLAAKLPTYTGPLEPLAFEQWGEQVVRHEAERYRITENILQEHRRLLYAAINRGMRGRFQDCSISPEDLFAEITVLILQNAHSLIEPGTAKLSTRLTSLAKKHVWYYAKKRMGRLDAVDRLLAQGGAFEGCETFSELELAAMREQEEKLAA